MNSLLLSLVLLCAADDVRYPQKPGPRDFVLDEAKLLTADDEAQIKTLCEDALSKKRAPIIVVTIPSLASYGARGWSIDRYAMNLMSEWGVGWEDWNYGMLLLVSPGDRKAKIELGASWARRKDEDARRIMQEQIIPQFKQGNYSKGILGGVRGLSAVALDQVPSRSTRTAPADPMPAPAPMERPTAPGSGCLPVGGIGLLVVVVGVFVVISFISRMLRGRVQSWGNSGPSYGGGYRRGYGYGGGGFGSGFGGGFLGGALGSILADQALRRTQSGQQQSQSPSYSPPPTPSSGGGDGPSFGGGSFGGGFSGGGGASGEW